jgi:hypothetical protein
MITMNILSALDNERSLYPLLVKDVIDNGGRAYMEYHRGGVGAQHAGRERLIEEFGTTAIWIGTRPLLNKVLLDPAMRLFSLDPLVDIMLFLKGHSQAMLPLIKKRQTIYLAANMLRFVVGTVIPGAMIALLIPSINQKITRQRLTLEEQVQKAALGRSMMAQSPHYPMPIAYAGYPARIPYSSRFLVPGRPMFGGQSMLIQQAARLINDPFWGNVAIDGEISSGRIYKARNGFDRLEVFGRELSIILFLYYLGDKIKGQLRQFFDKQYKTVSSITYNSIRWLESAKISPKQWQEQQQFLGGLTPKDAFQAIANRLHPQTGCFHKDPLLELARQQGLIAVTPTRDLMHLKDYQQLLGCDLTKRRYTLDPRKLLDIAELKETLLKTALQKPGLLIQLLQNAKKGGITVCLRRTSQCKFIAMLASYAVSTGCIAWLTPYLQHQLTYKLTGRYDFPGTHHYQRSVNMKTQLS